MKICFFADSESIHTIRWCNHFHEMGHEIHLISFKQADIPNIHCHAIGSGSIKVAGGNWKVLLSFRKVKKLLKQISPDIFHAHYATSYGITGALCNFHPYVITALGSDILISPKSSAVYRRLLRFAFKRTDLITVMSKQMKVETLKIGASDAKTMILPFGIDPKVFNAENKLLPENNSFTITSTRNFESVYNIPHLLRAVAAIKDQIPSLQLNLIGKGSLENELKLLVEELNISEVVTFFGKVTQLKIAEVLKQSHVFVSVSLSDGNNISLNEAMACETYCIATNIAANQEWIEDGVNGFLVEIDDVEKLAYRLLEVYQNYDILQEKAINQNRKLILDKGIWSNNMKLMENRYIQLIKGE